MKDLTQGSIGGHLAQMSMFIGVSMLIQTLYYIVDLYFVAGLGEHAIAGVSAAGTLMFIVLALTQVLGVSTVTLISHAVGRKDRADANLVFNQSLMLSAGCAGVVLLGGYALASAYMGEISADAETAAAGTTYLYWFLPCLALQFAMVAMGSALRGTGIVKPAMVVQALTVLLNIVLAPILIAGWGTGRPLGVMGAALASSIAILVGVVLLVVYFVRLEHYVGIDRQLWRPNVTIWRRMLNIGLPAGGEFAMMFLIMAVIYWCVRNFGPDAQAGFGIGSRVMQSILLPAMAIAFAASPIAGQNYGAQLGDRVRETYRTAIRYGLLITLAVTALCEWHPELLVGAFTTDPGALAAGSDYLRITAWNFAGMGIVFTCSAMFQALGNTWPALLSSAFRVATFVLPAIWLSTQSWVRLEHFWYLSVASVLLQALMSLLLMNHQLRTRLAFARA